MPDPAKTTDAQATTGSFIREREGAVLFPEDRPVETSAAAVPRVVIVEDDEEQRELLARWLRADGYEVDAYADAEAAINILSRTVVDVLCLDLDLPGMSGLEALAVSRERFPTVTTIMLTATRDVDVVVSAMQTGAYDYLPKPVAREKLQTSLRNAVEKRRMELRITQLERDVEGAGYSGILGKSPAMRLLFQQLDRVAPTDINVLVQGESGSGKELIARAIHAHSPRCDFPFVAFNCAAVPAGQQGPQLFGGDGGNPSRFDRARGGTLFLDEVSDLAKDSQVELLRLLEEHSFGGASGLRLVASSSCDLAEEVRQGRFREDLYFRLAVFELQLPPLRDRGDDVLLLAEFFLRRFSPDRELRLNESAVEALVFHDWPGNVRELENAIQRAAVMASGEEISHEHLPQRLRERHSSVPPGRSEAPASGSAVSLRDMEKQALVEALERTRGNISQVVRELGIGRTTVYRKLKKYGLR